MDTPAFDPPSAASGWPAHRSEVRPWRQSQRGGTREDRTLTQVAVAIPPSIAERAALPSSASLAAAERAVRAIAYADAGAGAGARALGRFMARGESVASSKIERIEASGEDLARAIVGNRANAGARSVVAATAALQELVLRAGRSGRIELADLLDAHRVLMHDDEHPLERRWAGRLRDVQNWIGGSDHSPRGAVHVPPPPELVEPLLDDLLAYADRDDVPAFVQAAVVHAQFESIHPFTDGNGRIGRALLGAVLQRRGITRNAVVPIASGLFALRAEYFAALDAYRTGDLDPIVNVTARAAAAAASEAVESFRRLQGLPGEWRDELGGRDDAAAVRILPRIFERPTLTSADFSELVGGAVATVYAAIDTLERSGIIREVTGRKRDRIWVVTDVVDELEDLDRRIQRLLA